MRTKIRIRDLSFHYRDRSVLENISLDIPEKTITSITGPSGQGKSTFLMTINRLWENIEGAKASGDIHIDFGKGLESVSHRGCDLPRLRQKAAMVFQVPNPLPTSIYKNISFPLKLTREKNQDLVYEKTMTALKRANLWEEVKDRLDHNAALLSGGQQQRLCIARALVLAPQILLLDEPTSSLDQDSVGAIEALLCDLKQDCTIIMVSHYMDQIKRIADQTYLLSDRRLVQRRL